MQREYKFTTADLTAFAELSGDLNPLHTDPIVARRTNFGECVVHGVFLLMYVLECFQRQSATRKQLSKVSARFLRPVAVGTSVNVTSLAEDEDRITFIVTSGGTTMMRCD